MGQMINPVFLPGQRGRLFGLYVAPAERARASLVYVPPFAEEMNRCRALATEQARRFAQLGVASLILDPFGTGESDGDLEAATWSGWGDDVRSACAWLNDASGTSAGLWGMRLGGLLAGELFEATPEAYSRLLLWQPVLNGKQFLTQYLRLRVAWVMERGLPAETTESIRAALNGGEVIEVAGYPLGQALTEGIDAGRFPAGKDSLAGCRIDIFEHGATADKPLSVATGKALANLREREANASAHVFTGPPLWQLHERDAMPSLLDDTPAIFGD